MTVKLYDGKRIVDTEQLTPRSDSLRTRVQLADEPAQAGIHDYRVVVVLRDIEDLSYEEIAVILELPLGTVKSRLHRARNMMRRRLENLMGDEG